jgi:hypothetical protein
MLFWLKWVNAGDHILQGLNYIKLKNSLKCDNSIFDKGQLND